MKLNVFCGIIFYLIIKEGQTLDCNGCSDYLISGPRGISDDKLTASSFFPIYFGSLHDPKYGRLYLDTRGNTRAGCWAAGTANDRQYIQAEFSTLKLVQAILTQGRSNEDQWVTSFSVSYSNDGLTWSTVKDVNKNTIIFSGNNDRSTVVTNTLPECLEAKYLRLNPKTWHGSVALRFDVIGCSNLDSKIVRRNVNWKKHPIILNPQIHQSLTQVFKASAKEINICAVKCQQNLLCQSFSITQNPAICIGYEEQIYQGDTTSFTGQGDGAYFVSLSLLEDKEFEIVENISLCYKIVTSKKTAAAALAMCKKEKARLLSIRNLDQINNIKDSIKNNLILSQQVYFYVDGFNKNGLWTYATDKNIPTSLWSPSHPLSDKGGCITLTLNGLQTHDCMDNLYFICEM